MDFGKIGVKADLHSLHFLLDRVHRLLEFDFHFPEQPEMALHHFSRLAGQVPQDRQHP